jgi:hypothetical protein
LEAIRILVTGMVIGTLVLIGSCTMLGMGAVAIVDKAADAAIKEQNNPEWQKARAAAADVALMRAKAEADAYKREAYRSDNSSYSDGNNVYNTNGNDDSDFGKPTMQLKGSSGSNSGY